METKKTILRKEDRGKEVKEKNEKKKIILEYKSKTPSPSLSFFLSEVDV
jgi:hypothetical protein